MAEKETSSGQLALSENTCYQYQVSIKRQRCSLSLSRTAESHPSYAATVLTFFKAQDFLCSQDDDI